MPRSWPALDVQAPSPTSDDQLEELQGAILAALDDAGVTAVQERPVGWRFYFGTADARDAAAGALHSWKPDLAAAAVDVPDEDWARRSQENLGPVRVGQVRISPPRATGTSAGTVGSSDSPTPLIDVVIQPSMGFGTGHHASTRLCVALLQQVDLVGRRVLDVGTGSGVLAIVAVRLGADAVLGVDDDLDALQSAAENLELNGMASGVQLQRADFRDLPPESYDVVTANLTGGLLVRGARHLLAAAAPGGSLILSGVALDEEMAVRRAFDGTAALLAGRMEEDGWVGLLYSVLP